MTASRSSPVAALLEEIARIERVMNVSGGKCSKCGESYTGDEAFMVMMCPSCAKFICEGCEVQRCDEGFHACPLCGGSLGSCGAP